jgi:Peptidase family C25/Propeptide_C25/Peptidase family C25, C terminal ig-like domain/HYDIN/CFA65/VesB-like, Ig-like domain/FlgD Ig-like domain
MKKSIIILLYIMVASLFAAPSINLGADRTDVVLENNSDYGLSIGYELSEINTFSVNTDEGLFDQIGIPGCTYSTRIGMPKLPVLRKLVTVPLGAEIRTSVSDFNEVEYLLADFGINNQLMPAQLPVSKSADPASIPFSYDAESYERIGFNSAELIDFEEIGSMRGMRIVALILEPVKYDPVAGKIRVYNNITVEVDFVGGNLAATQYEKERTYSHYFETVFTSSILNNNTDSSRDQLTRYPVKYVIVSDPMFETQLEPFVEWKTEKGFEVIEAYTNDPNVGTSTSSIKSFLQGLWDAATPEDPAPSFVLFVGDVAQIPAWNGATGGHITDLNYVKLDGANIVPDMYYGRFSANNATELQPQIDKTLMYEKYEMTDPTYLEEVVMIAGMDGTFAATHGNGQINYGTDLYFNLAHGITSHTYLYPSSGSNSANIIQNVSDGVGYINYTAHGGPTNWSNPSFEISDINSLQNSEEYCLAVGNCCLTNKFEVQTCFGEAWLRAEDKGAIGYIGGTNSTTWDEDYWWGVGAGNVTTTQTYEGTGLGVYDGLFHDHGEDFAEWTTTTGGMIWRGNMAVIEGGGANDYYWEIYSVMGDPSLEAYIGLPDVNAANYPAVIFLGVTTIQVTAEPYSYVSLSKDGVIYGTALVDDTGVVDMEFESFASPGMAKLVITKQNRQPLIADIEVIPAVGPFVVVESFQINDDNNSLPEYNETITVDMSFENVGVENALNASATLSADDDYVNISVDTTALGDIDAGSIVSMSDAFEIEIADDIPDQHIITFDVEVTTATDSWTSNIMITFNAPAFEIGTMVINDSGGNGMLDPGETATLQIPLTNIGHALSMEILTFLTSSWPEEVVVLDNNFNLEPLDIGGEGVAEFSVDISPDILPGTIVSLLFIITSGEYIVTSTLYPSIGLVFEDFETGDFSQFDWQQGTSDWEITASNPHEGIYCAKSSVISHNQTASISVTMDVPMDGEISFYRRVSSESNYDYLKFFVNGTMREEWAGDVNWSQVIFDVSTGTDVEFKWEYDKDGSMSSGSDCAWIDYIVFPGMGGAAGPIISVNVTEINFGEVNIGEIVVEEFTIFNLGSEDLTGAIDAVEDFVLSIDEFTLIAGSSIDVEVSFTPAEAINYTGNIVITSNDANQPEMEIPVDGMGIGTDSNNVLIPVLTKLYGNYPNPFNPTTTISYGLSSGSEVKLFVYNIKGQKIRTLVNKKQDAGYYNVIWYGKSDSGKNVTSGVYFYGLQVENEDYTSIKKVILLK